jgi:Flp pilus assembly protein TadG
MMLRRTRRRGAVLVESALVYPFLVLIVLGVVLLGVSVFRYQQVAHAAREASRWASVHGYLYAQENPGQAAATAQDVYDNAIAPNAAGMQAENLTYSVTWNADNKRTRTATVTDSGTGQSKLVPVANTVTVTVTYTWDTGLFGTIPVSSTSVSTMSY